MDKTDFLYEALLSTTASFIVLLILTRLLGKKQMSQLTFFNYITGITIGSIAANVVTLEGELFIHTLVGLIWWCLLTYIVDVLVLKLPKVRVILDGEPAIIIKKGKIQYKALKMVRLDIDNLLTMMREKDVFLITDIDYAILESNGELTIFKKAEKHNTIREDFNLPNELQVYIPTQIIINGLIVKSNLEEFNLTYDWVYDQLNKNGVDKIADVLYAELQPDGSLHIDVIEN